MQELHTLDARGCPCPQPLIKTRRLWKTLTAGEHFQVLVDNDIAHLNLMSFLQDQGADPKVSREGEDWVIIATRSGGDSSSQTAATAKQPATQASVTQNKAAQSGNIADAVNTADYIVVLKSDRMGQGDNELGRMLIKGYINTLRELDDKPSSIILYNGGVLLAARDSGCESALQALEKEGVEVIVCGACVDFFEIKEQMVTGRISNMYEIAEKIARTGHVVYP